MIRLGAKSTKRAPLKQRVPERRVPGPPRGITGRRAVGGGKGVRPGGVARIPDEAQLAEVVQRQRARLYEAIPDAVETIQQSVRDRSADAFELLDRTGVLRRRTSEGGRVNVAVGLNFGTLPVPEECSPYFREEDKRSMADKSDEALAKENECRTREADQPDDSPARVP